MPQTPRTILVATDHYRPGFKAGGVPRAVANLVDSLGGEYSFEIVTRDRDLGDNAPYPEDARMGRAHYLSPSELSFRSLKARLDAIDYDVLCLCSFFSVHFAIKLLLLRRIGATRRRPVILACHGELSPGALALKPVKKRAYIAVARLLGLYRGVIWQAASASEEQDIRRAVGNQAHVLVAPTLPDPVGQVDEAAPWPEKVSGELRVLFLSRISPMKNLQGAVSLLNGLPGQIRFDIYGPVGDARYWQECRERAAGLSPNITVAYHGALPHDQVESVFAAHDLLLLPTFGESFGHVVIESLRAGCPVLLSDLTPWRGLEAAGAGWDLPLDNPGAFRSALAKCVAMGPDEYRAFRRSARAFAFRAFDAAEALEANRALFALALG